MSPGTVCSMAEPYSTLKEWIFSDSDKEKGYSLYLSSSLRSELLCYQRYYKELKIVLLNQIITYSI